MFTSEVLLTAGTMNPGVSTGMPRAAPEVGAAGGASTTTFDGSEVPAAL